MFSSKSALRNLVGSKKMFSSKSGGDFFYESFEIWWGVFIKKLRNLVGVTNNCYPHFFMR